MGHAERAGVFLLEPSALLASPIVHTSAVEHCPDGLDLVRSKAWPRGQHASRDEASRGGFGANIHFREVQRRVRLASDHTLKARNHGPGFGVFGQVPRNTGMVASPG